MKVKLAGVNLRCGVMHVKTEKAKKNPQGRDFALIRVRPPAESIRISGREVLPGLEPSTYATPIWFLSVGWSMR
jgi:hypothetical protein